MAREEIGKLSGLPQIVADSPEWFSQMATIPLPPIDPAELKQRLWDEDGIEIPVSQANGRGRVRISVQGYNTRADVEKLVSALARLLPKAVAV